MRFKRTACIVVVLRVSCSVVALRIELSATRLSVEYGQPALDYRVSPFAPQKLRFFRGAKDNLKSGTSESNRDPPGPKPGVLPTAPVPDMFLQSERLDLNQRSPGPRPGEITRLRHVLIVLFPAARVGVEPNLIGLKDR